MTTAKDPDRPVRPLSAYMRFSAQYREKNGLKGGVETMKLAAGAWKELSAVEKAPFETAYTKEQQLYQKAFQEYKDSGKMDAWKRDPAKPKRPLTPYFQWATEQRKLPEFAHVKGVAEVTKMLKPRWEQVPAAKKAELEKTFKTEMEVYKKQMDKYDETPWLEKTGRIKDVKKAEAQKAKETEKKVAEVAKKKLAKEKETAKKAAAAEKEKLKLAKAKEKEKAAKLKAAEKEKKEKTAARAKELKAAEREKKEKQNQAAKAQKMKAAEKEKKQKQAAKEKERKAKEAAKAKAKALKAKEAAKRAAEKEKLAKMKLKEKEKAAKLKAKASAAPAKAKSKRG